MHLKLLKKARIQTAPKLIKENEPFLGSPRPAHQEIPPLIKSGKRCTVLTRAVWKPHNVALFMLLGQEGELSGAANRSLRSLKACKSFTSLEKSVGN